MHNPKVTGGYFCKPCTHAQGNLIGRAGQNLVIVTKESIHKISIDLQNTERGSGYDIIEQLEEYNAKSHDKTASKHTVFEIKV